MPKIKGFVQPELWSGCKVIQETREARVMTTSSKRDPYNILQVSPNAEAEVIEVAYKRLARKYHPDVNHSPEAKEKMQELNWAYEILRDVVKRQEYDNKRGKPKQSHSPPPQSKYSKQTFSTFDDLTQIAVEEHLQKLEQLKQAHLQKIEQSNKVKELKEKLDPVVKTILEELGDAQSQWLHKTGRVPDPTMPEFNTRPKTDSAWLSTIGLALDLLNMFLDETSTDKYSYEISGYFEPDSLHEFYYWKLDWKKFSSMGYIVKLQVGPDRIATLGIKSSGYAERPPIYHIENLSLLEIQGQLKTQAMLVYKEKIGA